MFENPRRGRQARNFTTNVPKILDLKSSSEQIFSENCRWVPLTCGWCTYPRFIHRKKTVFILALVTTALIVLTLFSFPRGTPVISEMSLYVAKDSDFKPVRYTRLAPCERKPEGDINSPDIRSNGTTRLRQAQLVLTRILRIFDLIAKKHGIRYWLYRGTLLGAARHNGHVPFETT